MTMRAASCFSGIMAAELAMPQYDWLWHAEIERFPCAVAAARYPESINLGDVLAPDFIERARALGPLDLMAGGPPCQAFSIAGLRGSLDDARGNLTLRWVQILHAIQPRNAITENVPGWLSTDDNAFGCFLGAIVGAGYPLVPGSRTPPPGKSNDLWRWQKRRRWRDRGRRKYRKGRHIPVWPSSGMVAGPRARAAWRILDAQYFGVAQRRERVFVVIDFGHGADPAEVLFERKGMLGNHPPSREKGKAVAALTSTGLGVGGPDDNQAQAGHLIHAIQAGATRENPASGPDGVGVQSDLAYTLEARPEVQAVAHTLRGEGFDAMEDGTGRGTPLIPVLADDIAPTLPASDGRQYGDFETSGGLAVHEVAVPVAAYGCSGSNGAGIGREGDPAFALDTQGQQGIVAYRSTGNAGTYETGDVVGALTGNRDPNGQFVVAPVDLRNAVRDPDKTGEDQRQGTGIGEVGDPSGSLTTGPVPGVICFGAKGSGQDVSYDLAPTMRAMNEVSGNANGGGQLAVAVALRGREGGNMAELGGDVANALRASGGGSDKAHVLVESSDPPDISPPLLAGGNETGGHRPPGTTVDTAETLVPCTIDATGFAQNQRDEVREMDVSGSLSAQPGMKQQTYVAFSITPSNSNQDYKAREVDRAQALKTKGGAPSARGGDVVMRGTAVRKLMPIECHRLQGFPDFWCDITFRNKPAADGPIYKALGNSWAVPVGAWLGRRLHAAQMRLAA